MQGRPTGPEVCMHCNLMLNCLGSPYADMVHSTGQYRNIYSQIIATFGTASTVCPRPFTPKKIKLVGMKSIDPPAWNANVTRDAAWKQLILRQSLTTSNTSPLHALLSLIPPPSQLQILLCLPVEQQRSWIEYWISQLECTHHGTLARGFEAGYVMSTDRRDIAQNIVHPETTYHWIYPSQPIPTYRDWRGNHNPYNLPPPFWGPLARSGPLWIR